MGKSTKKEALSYGTHYYIFWFAKPKALLSTQVLWRTEYVYEISRQLLTNFSI